MADTSADPLHAALLQLVTEALAPAGEDARWPWRPVGSKTGARDFWNPATWTLEDFDAVRTESRRLFSHCEFAIGGALTRKNYVVGQGFKYEVVPRDDGRAADPGVLREFNQFVTAFAELNRLSHLEKETQWRNDRDGNTLLRLFDDDIPAVRFVEPERLGEPPAADAGQWEGEEGGPPPDSSHALGVCTPKRDAQTVHGYWVSPAPGEPVEWVPEAEIVHLKVNVDSACRLGLPTYYPVVENLRRAEDTLQSMGTMAKARAKIALVEYVKNLTSDRAESQKARLTSGYQTMPDGTARQTTIEEIPFGARLRVPDSSRLEFPSANVGASDLVGVLQADLRAVAKLLDMPEWMFTGLADQKYSNAFVVEAPTLKAFSALQGDLVRAFGEGRYRQQASLVWRAIRLACDRGTLPREALPALRLKVTPPSLEVRDKASEASVNQTYVGMGAKSLRKVIEEQGGDPDEVFRQVDEEKKRASDQQPAAPDPLAGGGLPGLLGGAPTAESLGFVDIDGDWFTPRAARWVLEGRDRSHLVPKKITRVSRTGKSYETTVYVRPAGKPGKPKAKGDGEPPAAPHRRPAHLPKDRRRLTIDQRDRAMRELKLGEVTDTHFDLRKGTTEFDVRRPDGSTLRVPSKVLHAAIYDGDPLPGGGGPPPPPEPPAPKPDAPPTAGAAERAKAAASAANSLFDRPSGGLSGGDLTALAGHLKDMDSKGHAELKKKLLGRGAKGKKEVMAKAILDYARAKAAEKKAAPPAAQPASRSDAAARQKTLGERVQSVGRKVARWAAEASGDNQWLADNGYPVVYAKHFDGTKTYTVADPDGKTYRYAHEQKAAAEAHAARVHAAKPPAAKADPPARPGAGGAGLGQVIDGAAEGLNPASLLNLFLGGL